MEDKQEAEVFDSYCVEKIWPEEKAKQVFQIEKAFLKSYAASQEVPLAQWLAQELHKQLPEKSANEVEAISGEIISALQAAEEMKASQQKAIAIGRSKESWFASKVMQATADMPISERAEYLQSLEEAIKSANEATYKVIAAENGSSNSASASATGDKTEATEKRQESNSALNIGKQACHAGVQAAATTAGKDIAQKVLNGEEIDGDEVAKKAVDAGVGEAVKVAVAGAVRVAGEKGLIPQIQQLKGGSGNVCANVAFVAIENVKVAKQVADGKLTVHEGLEVMAQTTGACVAGIAVAAKGGAIVGSALGSVIGPWGTAIGGFVGNAAGYIAGSTIGGAVMQGAKALYDGARNIVKNVASAAKSMASAAVNYVENKIDNILSGGGGGCYITTATCQEYGKGDNCYELTMFRSFRDTWLRKQLDGEQLIKRYYATAPALVELINKQPNRRAIYRHLNEAYLSKCLRYIEDGENVKCKELYVDMVEFLYGEQQRWRR